MVTSRLLRGGWWRGMRVSPIRLIGFVGWALANAWCAHHLSLGWAILESAAVLGLVLAVSTAVEDFLWR